MERITLAALVALAKQLAANTAVYRPGMIITYQVDLENHHRLQMEIYQHTRKTVEGFEPMDRKFEFEVMDITFIFHAIV